MKVLLSLASYLLQSRFERILSGFEGIDFVFRTLNEKNIPNILMIEKPQIVIIDFNDRDEKCLNKLNKIKSSNSSIKTIVIAPTNDDEIFKKCAENGADYCSDVSSMTDILYILVYELLLFNSENDEFQNRFNNSFSSQILSMKFFPYSRDYTIDSN